MTYCVAALAPTGIVLASDSRTNAGTAEVASVDAPIELLAYEGRRTRSRVDLCAQAPAVRWH